MEAAQNIGPFAGLTVRSTNCILNWFSGNWFCPVHLNGEQVYAMPKEEIQKIIKEAILADRFGPASRHKMRNFGKLSFGEVCNWAGVPVAKYVKGLRLVQCPHCHKEILTNPDATHTGQRVPSRGTCEKCGTQTNWIVDVCGRLAYWCGCGN